MPCSTALSSSAARGARRDGRSDVDSDGLTDSVRRRTRASVQNLKNEEDQAASGVLLCY